MFTIFTFDNAVKNKQFLLGLSHFDNEETQDAPEDVLYVSFAFEFYDKTFCDIAAMIGDNTNVDKVIAKRAAKPFVGCASHRFIHSFNNFLKPYQAFIDDAQRLKETLSTSLLAAKLQNDTSLTLQLSGVTK